MKKFLLNGFLLSIPFLVYTLLVIVIDPFNLLNNSGIINDTIKTKVAISIEPHLYKIISAHNHPENKVILGDSRSNALYECMADYHWDNLAYGGGTIKEIVQSFWWVVNDHPVDTVFIGISFHLYNKCNKRFWVEQTLARKSNLFSYTFNRYTCKSTFQILKTVWSGNTITTRNMPFTKEEFWDYQINVTSEKYMEKYVYPDNYYRDLLEISDYCRKNNIKLVFWIPPSHIEFQEKVEAFGLKSENERFKKDLCSLGDVYDFDIRSALTMSKENFTDPLHFSAEAGFSIVDEIYKGRPHFSVVSRFNRGKAGSRSNGQQEKSTLF